MCQSNPLSSLEARTPQLPPEIIWIIIKDLLDDLSIAPPIPLNILTLNRHLHKLAVGAVYDTIIIPSLRLLYRFRKVIGGSPHLAYLVHNLWIGTPRLRTFQDVKQDRYGPFVAVDYILSKSPMIKKIALPSVLFPFEFAKLGSGIEHVTIGGGAIPELPCKVKTVHIHGSIQPSRVQCLKQKTLRRIVFDLEGPCKPGAIGHVIQELLGDEATKSQLRLELVIKPGISTWIEDELSQLSVGSSLEGVLAVRVRHPRDSGTSLRSHTYCQEWVEAIRTS